MKKLLRLSASILIACLLLGSISIPAYAEVYEFQEPYMKDAVRRSLILTKGWIASLEDDEYFTARSTIENDVTYLDLNGLNIEQLPDLSDFHALKGILLQNNPISDISSLDGDKRIVALNISNTNVKVLPDLPELRELLASNAALVDISTLSKHIDKLGNIQLLETPDIDYAPLAKAANLFWIYVGNSGMPLDDVVYQLLRQNAKLERVGLIADEFNDLTALAEKSSLEQVSLHAQKGALSAETLTAISNLGLLNKLVLENCGISSLTFLEHLTNLTTLNLSGNEIRDLAPLAGLPLTSFSAQRNEITDVTALASIPTLKVLILDNNKIADIEPLYALQELIGLLLTNNIITDISELGKLKNLTHLHLSNNPLAQVNSISKLKNLTELMLSGILLADTTPLSGLAKLETLALADNKIESVKPLAKLKNLTTLDMSGNPVTDPTPLAKLKALKEFNLYDAPVAQPDIASGALPSLHLGSRAEYDRLNEPFAFEDAMIQARFVNSLEAQGMTVGDNTTYQQARDCKGLDLSKLGLRKLPDLSMFLSLSMLDLSGNPGVDVTSLRNMDLSWISFEPEQTSDLTPLYTQTGLKTIVFGAEGYALTPEDVAWIGANTKLEGLEITASQPFDLQGLTMLPNLQTLTIRCSGTSDITLLAACKKLQSLTLAKTEIPDLTPVQSLGSLTDLVLDQCVLSGDLLAPLAKVKMLKHLSLKDMKLGDYTSIAKLPKLQSLTLAGCTDLSDLSPLAQLKKLQGLKIFQSAVSDLSPLAKLGNLSVLWMSNNRIQDVTPLAKLKKLESLALDGNQVADLAPIYKLKNLTELYLKGNPLTKEDVYTVFSFADFTTSHIVSE